MKVFYKNKVGILTERHLLDCSGCVFYPKSSNLYKCWRIGLMYLCCQVKCRKFSSNSNASIFKL